MTFQEKSCARKFKIGDSVRKSKGSQWHGVIVGTYSTELTPEGYAVESYTEQGSVQIYPAGALELVITPPQRTWVGLTDEERVTISYTANGDEFDAMRLAEAKLKEKNA